MSKLTKAVKNKPGDVDGCRKCSSCETSHRIDELNADDVCIECVSDSPEARRRKLRLGRAREQEARRTKPLEWKAPEGFDPDKLEGRDEHGNSLLLKGDRLADPVNPKARPNKDDPPIVPSAAAKKAAIVDNRKRTIRDTKPIKRARWARKPRK